MLYGIRIAQTEDGKYVTTCRDLPECIFASSSEEEAISDATKCIPGTIELFYRQKKRVIPLPTNLSENELPVYLPLKVQAKILLWNTIIDRGMNMTKFAAAIGVSPSQAQRLVDFSKTASIESIESALDALGMQFMLSVSRCPEE